MLRKKEKLKRRESSWHEKEIKRKKEIREEEEEKKVAEEEEDEPLFSSWRNSLLATHNHVSQSTGERKKKPEEISLFLPPS
jgi:hypothetical protein